MVGVGYNSRLGVGNVQLVTELGRDGRLTVITSDVTRKWVLTVGNG